METREEIIQYYYGHIEALIRILILSEHDPSWKETISDMIHSTLQDMAIDLKHLPKGV